MYIYETFLKENITQNSHIKFSSCLFRLNRNVIFLVFRCFVS